MFLRISSVGEGLILLGNLLFLFNVSAVLVRYYRAICRSAYSAATAEWNPVEAKP
jgi:hypothetical protein